ncbi:MAG: carbohydrate kinase family protein [Nocardioidaceae bacterium]
MHLATLGDLMLDVLVDVPGGLRRDDDSEAHISLSPGGQAANVAAWAVLLGARATVIGPLATGAISDLLNAQLASAGVGVVGVPTLEAGTVVSILDIGTRTMASDAGDQSWLSRLELGALPADAEWLHLSAYPLLRTNDPSTAVRLAEHARRRGAGVSLDLSSAALIEAYRRGSVQGCRHPAAT